MENYLKKTVSKSGNIFHHNSKGQFHRLDGPAVEYGTNKCWYVNGRYHRLDGPAIIWTIGLREWFIDGFEYTKSKHNRLVLFFTLEPMRIDLSSTED